MVIAEGVFPLCLQALDTSRLQPDDVQDLFPLCGCGCAAVSCSTAGTLLRVQFTLRSSVVGAAEGWDIPSTRETPLPPGFAFPVPASAVVSYASVCVVPHTPPFVAVVRGPVSTDRQGL